MSFNKITTSDLTNKGVSGLPDTPGLSTSEMQRKFDEIGKEVIVPKFNELVDELNKNGNVIKASDIVGIRVNDNKQIEVTTDFNAWYATASSGHVVIDKNGNTLPQRGTMKFVGESLVYDDPEHEQTVITAIQGAQGEEGPIGPVGPKGDRGQVYIPSIDEQGNISWTPADYTVPPAVRNIRGPQGVQGVQGPRGERGYNGKDGRSFSVMGQYESLEALQIAHPVGNEGDAYSVQLAEGNTIYLWDVDKREWVDIGSLQGPQGPQGEQGIQGIQGPPGIQGERGIPTSVNGLIGESIEVTPAVIPYTESKSLAALLGTTDISKYSDGTVTGAVKAACDKADANEAAIADVNSNLVQISYQGAGSHNAIYRGKNLGTSVTEAQYAAISAGTFDDLYIGDYWVINGVTWRIAAFDYYLHCGDSDITTHHAVIVPDTCLYNHVMNDTNTTDGGYVGSKMYKEGLEQAKTTIKAAFSGHVLSHRIYLTNAVANGKASAGAWCDSEVDLMNEQMVYGTGIFSPVSDGSTIPVNYRVEKSQLPLFAHEPSRICNRNNWWLRDVITAAHFARVDSDGRANCSGSSNSNGVRPAFCIKG